MSAYNPEFAPDPEWWLTLDESERLDLALAAQFSDERPPSPNSHAAIHVIVENQVAMGDATPVAATLERLLVEGLGRHDAIHAVGSVLAHHVYQALQHGPATRADSSASDPNSAYWNDLDGLSAEGWRRDR